MEAQSNTTTSDPPPPGNPYDELLEQCQNDPKQLQTSYSHARLSRTAAQRSLLLAPDFRGFTIDPVLTSLLNEPGFVDPRNCLVFWAKPPERVRVLVEGIQRRLVEGGFGSLWPMPPSNLHLTVLEIAHSLPYPAIARLSHKLHPHLGTITDYTLTHRARLVKPRVNYDGSAIALSFLPASGGGEGYTYHHLRRDVYDLVTRNAGVEVASRYTVASAHLTIARFVEQSIWEEGKVGELIKCIEEVNKDLERDYGDEGQWGWTVGEEKGLVCREGRVWYGGGESLGEGKGF
ncbi:MAG: hypothetical protein OHK93_005352 [Ramalina farinacea]|uniref:RNA ligase/cyclic nucleotide phosphodiesterase n=1 Tax=Ramalina farinacea TaxID=258253 RepID=A0AA43TVX2_9LECA|nr:hypothetical protein [Ramalina farinacea]